MSKALTTAQKLLSLREPLSASNIEWRVGAVNKDKTHGQALPYLKFVAVADRLDDVMGPENWTCQYKEGPAGGVVCRLSLRIEGEWIPKENGAENTEFEPVKGGMTDALKRAAAMWGIGRYLYRFDPPWVEIRDGKYLVSRPTLPDEFLPVNERTGRATGNGASNATPVGQGSAAGAVDPSTGEVLQPGEVSADGFPLGLMDSEKELITELLARAAKGTPATTIRGYVSGYKGKEKLSEPARKFVLAKIPA